MSGPTSLTAYATQLGQAAGTGAAKIASSAKATGTLRAQIGFLAPDVPGPALQSVLDKNPRRAVTATAASQIPAIADRMAKRALDQGARLLSGDS